MEKAGVLYEGKAKKIFETSEPGYLWVEFKDDTTAFDGLKKELLDDKGALNNQISSIFLELLAANGIATHYERLLDDKNMLVKRLHIIPVEVIVRNIVAGSMSKRLGIPEGTLLKQPVIEYCLKSDELHDPMINLHHIYALELASEEEMKSIQEQTYLINDVLVPYLEERGIALVDFKLEFGRHSQEGVILGDEITPDSCRFWDISSGEKMDKDRFRRDLGGVTEAYREILKRLKEGES